MKSHDIAKKLLEQENQELYIENKYFNGTEWVFQTDKISAEQFKTPDGLFLETESIYTEEILSPNDEPQIGSYRISFMNESVITKIKNDNCKNNLKKVSIFQYDPEYLMFNNMPEPQIVLEINKIPGFVYTTNEHVVFTVNDVDYFEVLVDYDKTTWKPVYKKMTFDEAKEFGINMKF